MTRKVLFGIFSGGKLLFAIGNPVNCTPGQAEFIACLLETAVNPILKPGTYLAYDYVQYQLY